MVSSKYSKAIYRHEKRGECKVLEMWDETALETFVVVDKINIRPGQKSLDYGRHEGRFVLFGYFGNNNYAYCLHESHFILVKKIADECKQP